MDCARSHSNAAILDGICEIREASTRLVDIYGTDDTQAYVLKLTYTKLLVKRPIYIPIWLMRELKTYIAGKRAKCIAGTQRVWLGDEAPPPPQLFLNCEDADRNLTRRVQTGLVAEGDQEVVRILKSLRHKMRRLLKAPSALRH